MGGVIDRFFMSLGFVPETSGLNAFRREAEAAKQQILSIGDALKAFAAGFAVREIAKIGDEFEQNTIALAGFFDALGMAKPGDFDNAMALAGETMDQIIRDAALLPGEAEEYIEVFRAGLPVIKDAVPTMDRGDITGFTNKLTAIAHTLKVPVEVTSREMQELFIKGEGHATRINVLFKRFLPFLRQVEGQANLTTKSFNAMTAEKRVQLFQDAFVKLDPMLQRAASSFDAMWGAFVSGLRQITRYGTKALFEGMKGGLKAVNDALFTADGQMTATARSIVDGLGRVSRWIGNTVRFVVSLVTWVGRLPGVGMAAKGAFTLLGVALAGLALEGTIGKVALLMRGLLDMKKLLTGALFAAIFLVAEDLYVFSKGGDSVTGMLVNRLGPAGLWIARVVLGGLVAALFRVQIAAVASAARFAVAWVAALGPIGLVIGAVAAVGVGVYELWKHWDQVVAYMREHFTTFTAVVAAAWETARGILMVGIGALKSAWRSLTDAVVPLIGMVVAEARRLWDLFGRTAVIATLKTLMVGLGLAIAGVLVVLATVIGAALILQAAYYKAISLVIDQVVMLGTAWDRTVAGMSSAWDALVDGLKDTWNSFANLINRTGVVTLPTFETHQMLPAGEGVLAPETTVPEGPWQTPYATGGGAEGPTYIPTAAQQVAERDRQMAPVAAVSERRLARLPDLAKERNRRFADAVAQYQAAQHSGNPAMVGAPAEGPTIPYLPTAYLTPSQAPGGASASAPVVNQTTNTYVTRIESPRIEVRDSIDPTKTARAIEKHMNDLARRGTRQGQGKSVL